MKISTDIKRFTFYVWVGAAYLLLWLLSNLVNHPDTFFIRALNETWRAVYIIVLNFILFEYTLPFIKLTWKRILIGLLLLWIHIMLYSFGLYGWRSIGIQLHIYTPLRTFDSVESGAEYQVSYSVG